MTHLELDRPPKPELVAQGWQRRFVTDGRRLREYVELYESMGFEIHAEPLEPEEVSPDCGDCRLIILLQFHTLYTRKRS
jgi:hypothetical protein